MTYSLALSDIVGAPVIDSAGDVAGRVREVTLCPQENPVRITGLVVKTKKGIRMLSPEQIVAVNGGVRTASSARDWPEFPGNEGYLLLARDLLDQQIIDVHGRKVVRVNDVDLHERQVNQHIVLEVGGVDVGARGAMRRLLKGVVPHTALRALLRNIPPRLIPWEFVDLIETDPARRVKLKIEHSRLARLHPADIAEIVEDLTPAEREAVFETLDEEVAAEALEEVDPKLQRSIVRALDSDRAADIVEEMDPDAAADLLGDLPQETSEEILDEMEPEQREEVEELLEHQENTAAGRMTTDYLALHPTATVHDAIETLRNYEGGVESVSTMYLLDESTRLVGAVPLPKLVLAPQHTPLVELTTDPLISCHETARDHEVAELFDKYNLLTLPVLDDEGKLMGVITADDVISLLRERE